jgi:polysaccharide biosynthesis/export protein
MILKKIFIFSLLFLNIPLSTALAQVPYVIGPGDLLDVYVWKDDALSRQILDPPDGIISFPLIGEIQTTGMTIHDLEKELAGRLSKYLPDTPVTVSLRAANSLTAYVIGKVNKPGQFPISLDSNVMQVLAMAGGLSPYADSKKIIVLRRQGGQNEKLNFNFDEVQKGNHLEQNVILQRGDVVVVP